MKKMKKKFLFITAIVCLLMMTAGCAADEEKDRMENQISQLEQQVEDLKADQSSVTGGGSNLANTTSDALDQSGTDPYSLDSTKSEVGACVTNVQNAVVPTTAEQKRESYFNLNAQLEQQESRLDRVEDQVEADYRKQEITYEQYQAYERMLDQLEDQLGQAEDQLEFKFGIDD